MKRILYALSMLFAATTMGQQDSVSIVFDVTSADIALHQSTMRHIQFMATSYPNAEFEVVVYSGSVSMVLKESKVSKEILQFQNNPNVTFKVCAVTLKRKKISKAQLLSGVEIVPDGIMHIAQRQAKGWAYIKESK